MNTRYECAVITGASSGLGRALAARLAEAGVKVAMLGRRLERMAEQAAAIEASGGAAAAIQCDVTDPAAVQHAMGQARDALGPIDLLIANAGVAQPMAADQLDLATFEWTYRVNVFGALYAIAAVLPDMIQRRQGHIVGISSQAAYRAYPRLLAYCGSKAAMNQELEAIRNRVHQWNIDVTTICPGFIRTAMTEAHDLPQPMRMELEPAVDRIYRAIRRRRKFYTFPLTMAWYHRLMNILPPAVFDPFARSSFTP